jgi:hypothetical protein
VNGTTGVSRTLLVLGCAVLFTATACTTGAPTSPETAEPTAGTSQPASALPSPATSTTLTPTASPAPKFGAWKRLANQPTFARAEVNDVVKGGPGYVAIGCERSSRVINEERPCTAAAWSSRDGLQWTRSANVTGATDAYMHAVAVGGPGFVAVGTQAHYVPGGATFDAAVWTSIDGVGWSRVPFSEGFKYGSATDVVAFGGGFVASGQTLAGQEGGPDAVWTSSNGRDWRRENTDEFQSFTSSALGVLGDRLILSGQASSICAGACRRQIWTSENGADWTRAPDSPAFDGAVNMRPELEYQGRMLTSGFVSPVEGTAGDVPQTRASLWSSTDGVAWERVAIPAPKRSAIGDIVSVGSGLIAAGSVQGADGSVSQAVTWTSADGRNWKLEAVDSALRGVAIPHVLVTDQGLVAFGARQSEGISEHAGLWLRSFERSGG